MEQFPDLTMSSLSLREHLYDIQMSGLDARAAIFWVGMTAWLETIKLWTMFIARQNCPIFRLLAEATGRTVYTAMIATAGVSIWRFGANAFGLDYSATPRWGEILSIIVCLTLCYRTFFRLFPTPTQGTAKSQGESA